MWGMYELVAICALVIYFIFGLCFYRHAMIWAKAEELKLAQYLGCDEPQPLCADQAVTITLVEVRLSPAL